MIPECAILIGHQRFRMSILFTRINLRGAFSGIAARVVLVIWGGGICLLLDLVHFQKKVIKRRKGKNISIYWRSISYDTS